MSEEPIFNNLQPSALIDEIKRLPSSQLDARYSGIQFLLVELRDDCPELEAGLVENHALVGRPPSPSAVSAATTVTFPALRAAGARASLEGMDRIQLLAKLSGARHFVLPLFKREGGQFKEASKISVGRNKGTDVTLCHSSVSKLHAWFEMDSSGALYLFEAKSLNGTRVNGKPVTPEEPQWLQPMDQIQFGSINAFTCTPAVLRGALRSLGESQYPVGTLEVP
jgi:hypothetical protein